MKKGKAIIILLVFVLLLGGFGYTAATGLGSEGSGSASSIKLGLDLAGGVSITYQVVGDEEPSAEDMADTIYKLQQRVENYSTEAVVYKEGTDRINIEIPGVSDANAILEELGKPGSLVFMNEAGEEVLTGTDIKSAEAANQQNSMGNTESCVRLTMTEEGTKKFADATTAAAPTQARIYIIYDDQVVSSPSVQTAITNGEAVISPMESYEAAETLASTIRIGGLKLQLEELRSNVVGAQLGADAIDSSIKAAAIGFAIIVVFMLLVYYVCGLAASLALTMYVELMVILLSAFNVTLTLPGIAGIILSIGMAVDANVIIFARIREELATGKTVNSAVQIGFKKAMSAILDGNITTLIAAAVLGVMGTGTIKGFATTLALGIVLSMFTALFVTRWILNAFYAIGIQNVKYYGIAREKKTINFLSKKAIFFTISIALILAGFVVMGVNKVRTGTPLAYSLEFVGGTSSNVTFNEQMSLKDVNAQVVPLIEEVTGDGNVQVTTVEGTNEVIIKTRSLTVDEREAFNKTLVDNFSVDETKITTETISSTVSSEMKRDAFIAVIVSTIFMLIYIWFRFKDVRFGTSAVLALVHDVLIVLAFYAVARVSVSNTFIACMLTIVGYSVNATIVIFDRIRENMKEMKKKDEYEDVVNRSITQTLSRSIFSSLTTFVMVAALYVLGVTSVREFALPLMVGIISGTYSSICLTGAMWMVMKKKLVKKEK